jgi:hypothetical protein
MIKSPRLIHASNSTRPYTDQYNVASVYDNNVTTNAVAGDDLTDEEINALINADRFNCVARGDSIYNNADIHDDLYGDDYADAILADL